MTGPIRVLLGIGEGRAARPEAQQPSHECGQQNSQYDGITSTGFDAKNLRREICYRASVETPGTITYSGSSSSPSFITSSYTPNSTTSTTVSSQAPQPAMPSSEKHSYNGFDKTTQGWVVLPNGIRAQLVEGRIEAEINLTAAQADGKMTYSFDRADKTKPKSAEVDASLKNISQRTQYSDDLQIKEHVAGTQNSLKVTALNNTVEKIRIAVTDASGQEQTFEITREMIRQQQELQSAGQSAASPSDRPAQPLSSLPLQSIRPPHLERTDNSTPQAPVVPSLNAESPRESSSASPSEAPVTAPPQVENSTPPSPSPSPVPAEVTEDSDIQPLLSNPPDSAPASTTPQTPPTQPTPSPLQPPTETDPEPETVNDLYRYVSTKIDSSVDYETNEEITTLNLANIAAATRSIENAKNAGSYDQLKTSFKRQYEKDLEEYIFENAAKTASPKDAYKIIYGQRIADGLAAIFHEAFGNSNERTLDDILKAFTKEELKTLAEAWNKEKSYYKGLYGYTFNDMLKRELGVEAQKFTSSTTPQAGARHELTDKQIREIGTVLDSVWSKELFSSSQFAQALSLIDNILKTHSFNELEQAYSSVHEGKSLKHLLYEKAATCKRPTDEVIRLIEDPVAVSGVEAIFYEAKGGFSNPETLKHILTVYEPHLPAIQALWDKGYKGKYDSSGNGTFEKMIYYELSDYKSDAARFKKSCTPAPKA
jgi:hypothetical protein